MILLPHYLILCKTMYLLWTLLILRQLKLKMFKSLKTGKATAPDHINNRVLKELSRPLSSPLCELFNFSVSSGKVPDIWKQANITPIFKKDDASDSFNYRPISLLSCIGKVLEKLVHKYVLTSFVTMRL